MEVGSPDCAHQEIIQRTGRILGEELGTCTRCGRQKLYYWKSGKRDFRILFRGDPDLASDPFTDIEEGAMTEEFSAQEPTRQTRNRRKPTGRLSERKKEELLKIGVPAFAKKYAYKHTGMLTAIYNKLAEEAGIKDPDVEVKKPGKATPKPENGRRRPRKNASEDPEEELSTIRACVKQIRKHPANGARRIVNYLQEFFSSNGKT